MMGFDPEELGQPPEDTSEPLTAEALFAMAGLTMPAAAAATPRAAPRTTAQAQAIARQAALRQAQLQAAARVANPFDEIDERLSLASYYRAVLEQPLFDEANEFAELVEQEVRQFIMDRLGDLLGTSKPKPPVEVRLPFTPAEVNALRLFAQALLTKQPSIAKAALPSAPAPEPQVAEDPPPPPPQRVAPKAPRVRRARGPQAPEVAPAPPPPPPPAPRRALAPRTQRPARPAPVPEPEVEEPVEPEQPEAPDIKPVPMPRGEAYTQATAMNAALTMQNMDREISRQLKPAQ